MKKSLCLLALCFSMLSTYAQDDDVYFVPSSKNKKSQPQRTEQQAFPEGRSTYTPIEQDATFAESNWADGRGNGTWDVDAYNRRGKNYRGECADTASAKSCYDQGYADGYEDGSYTARIVRFWSPRPGVYVSSPYYMDYYDLCYYDPWYYGYGTAWSWGWSGWYGWGSWYGWRPYYSWGWGWGPSWGWYDPWWGYHWHNHYYHAHYWYPATAERGPRGGWIDYGGRRGTNNSFAGRGTSTSRPSRSMDFGRGTSGRRTANFGGTSGSGGRSATRPSSGFGTGNRSTTGTQRNPSTQRGTSTPRNNQSTSQPSRSFNNRSSSGSSNRGSSFSSPSRSSGSFGGGGGRSFGGGGSRGRR